MRKLFSVLAMGAALVFAPVILADGTEALGPPSTSIATGTSLVVAGVGTETSQPGTIAFNVNGTAKQALLYWSGHYTSPNTGDNTIAIEGGGSATLGKTAAGPGTSCPSPNYKYANKVTLGSSGFATTLSAVMSGSGSAGAQDFRMMIYSDNGGAPAKLLAESSTVSVAGTAAAATVNFPLASDVFLAAGTYWIAQQSGGISGGSGQGCASADHTTGVNAYNTDNFSDGPSSTYGAATTEPNEWSFSATLKSATPVTGTSIGGPSCFFALGGLNPCTLTSSTSNVFQTYRADITSLGLVHSGANSLTIGGLDFHANDGGTGNTGAVAPNWPDGNEGAGIAVISDDGSSPATIGLRDGQDLAFVGFGAPFSTTVPQTFTFPSSTAPRTANLATMASSVEGPASGFGPIRPNQLVVSFAPVGGTQTIQNPWGSTSGPEFDAINTPITIPAGATSLTVQALSAADPANPSLLPASLNWLAAGLSVPPAAPVTCGLGDFVWIDANGNGIQDDGASSGINGVVVELLDASGNPTGQTTTTANNPVGGAPGWYHFDVTCGGTYKVRVAASNFASGGPLQGDAPTTLQAGTDKTIDSNGDVNSTSEPVTVPSGQNPTIDFGYVPCGTPTYSTSNLTVNGQAAVKFTFTQALSVNDNTYGANAIGWGGANGHKFNDLVGSDKAEFLIKNSSGGTVFDFYSDYISQSSAAPSGYASLGPFGGDGKFVAGNQAAILGFTSSLTDDLNNVNVPGLFSTNGSHTQLINAGNPNVLVDSPAPVSSGNESQGAATPFSGWDYRDTYSVTILASALPAGYTWSVPFQHNSPAKDSSVCTCVDSGSTAATLATSNVTVNGQPAVKFSFTQSLGVNDNTYGANAIGWGGANGHKFNDLVGSDKAEFLIKNSSGGTVFDFYSDYVSQSSTAPSGYASLGPFGGDGKFVTGNQAAILGFTTSLTDDLNNVNVPGLFSTNGSHTQLINAGNPNVLVDSPAAVNSANESQGAAAPFGGWDYKDSYSVTILASALPAGYTWSVPLQHNSPAKQQSDCAGDGKKTPPPPPPPPPPNTNDQLNTLKHSVDDAAELKGPPNDALRKQLDGDLALGNPTDPKNMSKACTSLSAFISDVLAKTAPSGQITAADSASWISAANAIKAAIGC